MGVSFGVSASPTISPAFPGIPAAWGDLAQTTEPMLGNLFAVYIYLPSNVKASLPATLGTNSIINMLASGVTIPQEEVQIEEVATKLSTYDVVVGKTRGELGITFKEQAGAPVSMIMSAWHKQIVDARNAGIGFPGDYATKVWIAALAGNGTPYYWWYFNRCFPKARGNNPTFANDAKNPVEIEVPFSYLEMFDGTDAAASFGAAIAAAPTSVL